MMPKQSARRLPRPSMRFVPIKSIEQQADLTPASGFGRDLSEERTGHVESHFAVCLAEFGPRVATLRAS